jgi:L-ascorbate metabolism protein UlaG (beta-lactamase superfamily)
MTAERVTVTLIGGPTMVIEIAGLRILTDPTFDPPQSYEGGVLLTKRTGPAIEALKVLPVDVVLLSHDQHVAEPSHSEMAATGSAIVCCLAREPGNHIAKR